MSDLLKRIGIIKVTKSIMEHDPEGIIAIFKDVLIIGTRDDFMSDSLIYKGYSMNFDLVKEGDIIPSYDVQVSGENGELKVTWFKSNTPKGIFT